VASYNIPLGSRDVIGTGMRSPFSFSVGKSVRAVTVSQGIDKIIASIQTILKTRPGERFMQPEFGSRLYDLVFEPNDRFTNQLLYYYTVSALERWERRIKVTNVQFQTDENRPGYIGIVINFYILQTHQHGSYVFPFEKTGMSMPLAVTGSESKRIFTKGTVLPIQGRA
jgi:phage baseplate assembly protein W